jgi:hypothetical protein
MPSALGCSLLCSHWSPGLSPEPAASCSYPVCPESTSIKLLCLLTGLQVSSSLQAFLLRIVSCLPTRAICPAHLTALDLITVIVLGEEQGYLVQSFTHTRARARAHTHTHTHTHLSPRPLPSSEYITVVGAKVFLNTSFWNTFRKFLSLVGIRMQICIHT